MGELLMRRREMVQVSTPPSDIIYELATPMVFDGTNAVNTGVYLLGNYSNGTAPSFTILFNGTPTNLSGDKYCFAAYCPSKSKLMLNFSTYGIGNVYVAWFAGSTGVGSQALSTNKFLRIALIYESGGNAVYKWVKQGGSVQTKSFTTSTGAIITGENTSESVKIGSSASMAASTRFVGTVNLFRIYNRKLTDSEVTNVLTNGGP